MSKEDQEIWKTYPEYDFIEVSNLGRVRTKDRTVTRSDGREQFVKGRVLKQQLQRNGYMYVGFGVNGKTVRLLTHRMVAISYVPNPNNYSEVNHKDNDRTNNVVSNLEWCTVQYNIAYREKYGVSAREATKALRHSVFAIDLKTGKVLRFGAQNEAAYQLGISRSSLYAVINGKRYTAGGYWVTEDESEITEEKIQEINAKMHLFGGVVAVNLDNFNVLWFESQSEAALQLGVNVSHVSAVVKGKRNKAGGCWFTYADENAVEKARTEFGDEIAKKVEKLMSKA